MPQLLIAIVCGAVGVACLVGVFVRPAVHAHRWEPDTALDSGLPVRQCRVCKRVRR